MCNQWSFCISYLLYCFLESGHTNRDPLWSWKDQLCQLHWKEHHNRLSTRIDPLGSRQRALKWLINNHLKILTRTCAHGEHRRAESIYWALIPVHTKRVFGTFITRKAFLLIGFYSRTLLCRCIAVIVDVAICWREAFRTSRVAQTSMRLAFSIASRAIIQGSHSIANFPWILDQSWEILKYRSVCLARTTVGIGQLVCKHVAILSVCCYVQIVNFRKYKEELSINFRALWEIFWLRKLTITNASYEVNDPTRVYIATDLLDTRSGIRWVIWTCGLDALSLDFFVDY